MTPSKSYLNLTYSIANLNSGYESSIFYFIIKNVDKTYPDNNTQRKINIKYILIIEKLVS